MRTLSRRQLACCGAKADTCVWNGPGLRLRSSALHSKTPGSRTRAARSDSSRLPGRRFFDAGCRKQSFGLGAPSARHRRTLLAAPPHSNNRPELFHTSATSTQKEQSTRVAKKKAGRPLTRRPAPRGVKIKKELENLDEPQATVKWPAHCAAGVMERTMRENQGESRGG